MKKIIVVIIWVLCFFSVNSVYAYDDLDLDLYSQYAYLVDPQTDIVYIDQQSDEKIFPASMTKILTVSLALEKIDNLQEEVTITQLDLNGLFESGASVAGFYSGEVVTYEDLLYGALLPSGADACNALARLTYGDMTSFVEAMNQQAANLNLQNTHFVNATGLHDDQHYTTVKEMAIILEYALQNAEFVKIFETQQYQSSNGVHQWSSTLRRASLQQNIDISNIDGAKSGFTDEAQLTLASTMTIDGHQLILVTAYAQGQYSQNNVKDAVAVYQYMNDNYHNVTIYQKDENIYDYWILRTFQLPYHYIMSENLSLLLEQDISYEDLDISIQAQSIQIAPLEKGQSLGKVIIQYQDQILYEYQITLNENISTHIVATIILYGIVLLLILIIICVILKILLKKHVL